MENAVPPRHVFVTDDGPKLIADMSRDELLKVIDFMAIELAAAVAVRDGAMRGWKMAALAPSLSPAD